MKHYVSVALPIPTKRQFTYFHQFNEPIQNGSRVLVSFGKNTLTGIVVEQNATPINEAKEIIELLDDVPVFNTTMLQFTKWIADYYYASWGETLAVALPQGMTPHSVISVVIKESVTNSEIEQMSIRAPKRMALMQLLMNHKGPLSISYIQKQLNTDSVSIQLEALENAGIITIKKTLEDEIQPKVLKAVRLPQVLFDNQADVKKTLDELDFIAPKQSAVFGTVYMRQKTSSNPCTVASILKDTHSTASAIIGLVKKGLLEEYETEVIRGAEEIHDKLTDKNELLLPLTDEQLHAVSKINEAISHHVNKTFLLHGITGSGKTLVYLHAIEKAISQGKTALILVPEISLTPQLVDRFTTSFGESVAVLHSKIGTGERYDIWRGVSKGKYSIVLGARSAIFAPLPNIGLIIVDEEHETSYKQDSPSPRYNARDGAVIRGIMEQSVVVLGSATPSLESMFNATTGKYHLLSILNRADGASLPPIKILDILDLRKKNLTRGNFSIELIDTVIDRIQKKEGVILLQNRRGFAPRLECIDCGNIPQCYQCNVPLTYHKSRDQLRCHYCGWTIVAIKHCNVCGSVEMKEMGTGTERVVEELEEQLTLRGVKANIVRVDGDTTSKKGSLRKILTAFSNGESDILVGTQLIAKGLDLGRVTLVGVINADLTMYIPDFRAGERTFQLLTQVAGRAGRRGDKEGLVLIQTSHPNHQSIISTKLGRYDVFYDDELQVRKEAMYPPFSRLVIIELTGKDQELVHQHAHYFTKFLPKHNESVVVLGPSKPHIDRVRTMYRRHIIVKGIKSSDATGNILRHAINTAFSAYYEQHATSSVRVVIDIDSYSTL